MRKRHPPGRVASRRSRPRRIWSSDRYATRCGNDRCSAPPVTCRRFEVVNAERARRAFIACSTAAIAASGTAPVSIGMVYLLAADTHVLRLCRALGVERCDPIAVVLGVMLGQ